MRGSVGGDSAVGFRQTKRSFGDFGLGLECCASMLLT